jgi:CubicO group peptidase (beta-lactamase class C family)
MPAGIIHVDPLLPFPTSPPLRTETTRKPSKTLGAESASHESYPDGRLADGDCADYLYTLPPRHNNLTRSTDGFALVIRATVWTRNRTVTCIRGFAPLLAMLCVATIARADGLSGPADPVLSGFSAARLMRIGAWLQARADALKPTDPVVPGAVVAIAREGSLAYLQAIGFQDRAKTIPMQANSIFWIASMTKPVTSVAAMILVDEGKLELDAPVARYLPEVGAMQVARPGEKGGYELEPSHRAMTVRDLLRHTSGLVYPGMDFADPGPASEAIHTLYNSKPIFESDSTLADFVSGLAGYPLAHQPGEVWEYSWGADVLARVVEVASGEYFDEFLQTRIFGPLKMVDTGFFVPADKLDRLVDPPGDRRSPRFDISRSRKLLSGGGGLASTALDYLRFCQMLLNNGELDGVRILSSQAVITMTADAMPPGVHFAGSLVGPRYGTTWGLGFEIRTDPITSHAPGSVGSFRWSGVWGTYFWVDPAEKLAVVQMIQADPGATGEAFLAIRRLAYGALTITDRGEQLTSLPALSPEALSGYEGFYTFGRSTSARDPDHSAPFGGIGLDVRRVGGEIRVLGALANTPAVRAGLRAGDVVTAINGIATAGLDIDAIIARLRGAPGTQVSLEVRHVGAEGLNRIVLVRGLIQPRGVDVNIRLGADGLIAEANGLWPILDFDLGKPIPLAPLAKDEFRASGEDRTHIRFVRDVEGKITGAILDPGPDEFRGVRID